MESILGILTMAKGSSYPVLQIKGNNDEPEQLGIITNVDAAVLARTFDIVGGKMSEGEKLDPRNLVPYMAPSGRIMFRPEDEKHHNDSKGVIVPSEATISGLLQKEYNVYPTESPSFFLIDFEEEEEKRPAYVPFKFERDGRTFFRVIDLKKDVILQIESVEQYDVFTGGLTDVERRLFPVASWVPDHRCYNEFSRTDWKVLEPTILVPEKE